ncbi:MAG: helix-turn-helix domain-containing protein [Lysobacter sp.]
MTQSDDVASGAHSCGARLKNAREKAKITQEEVSARLKMPLRVIRSLENDDWQTGSVVFVRGQLRSYAKLLDIDIEQELVRAGVSNVVPSTLVSHTHTPRYQRVFEQATRRAVYIAITAVIAVPVWLATRPHLSNAPDIQSLEVPAIVSAAVDPIEPSADAARQRTPVIASMGSLRATAASETTGLSLSFNGDSWVQVFAADGRLIEQGLLSSGDQRDFGQQEVGRVVLGNVSVVDARKNGKSIDLTLFSRANVARFTLSSDGSLAPVID